MGELAKIAAKKSDAKSEILASRTRQTELSQSLNSPVDQILFLQRTIGNQAVQRLIKSGALQAKLRLGAPGDVYEQEADRVAEQVMRMPEPLSLKETKVSSPAQGTSIQSSCPKCIRSQPRREEKETIQTKEITSSTPGITPELESCISSIRGGGQSLPEHVRAFFEPRFGHDFSEVRAHTDAKAAEAARALNARAFTVGKDVVFGEGEYAPGMDKGKKLIAHELVHMVQQNAASPFTTSQNQALPTFRHPATSTSPLVSMSMQMVEILQRFPGVEPDMVEGDKKLTFKSPTDGSIKPIYSEASGYIKNPSSKPLSSLVEGGKISGGFENGKFMYVIDQNDNIWIGKRLGEHMPHPTLLGGKNPQVKAAGIVEIQGGKIVYIDNHSGHYRPPRSSLRDAVRSFLKLDEKVFKDVKVWSVHVEEGKEIFKRFRSIHMLKLKKMDFKRFLKKFRWPSIRGQLRSRGFKRMAGGLAALLAIIITDLLMAKLLEDFEEKIIQRDIENLEPKVRNTLEKALEAKSDEFDALLERNPDAEIYVNVRYRIGRLSVSNPEGELEETSAVQAEFVDAGYSLEPWSTKTTYSFETVGCTSRIEWQTVTVSEKIPLKDLFEE